MPSRVAVSTLNASTIDILNVIRANASAEYMELVPKVTKETDIPKVGEVLYGYPALANQFLSSLINRIASVRIKSAVFNNAYAELKKGFLEFGEVVEEVFVQITKAREFSVEKMEQRELKRSLPDVKSAFHAMNWRVQYPVTIQQNDLHQAFMSMSGVQNMIAKIVNAVYTAADYDEFLLFKYLLIKAASHGKMFPVTFDASEPTNAAVAFREIATTLPFMSDAYNVAHVHTTTPIDDLYIFMSAKYNAEFDVNVLAAAFNMEKADFMGHLKLIDNWTSFDNDRFSEIMAGSDMLEPITDEELQAMENVKAIAVDKEFFQVYDNLALMSEKYIASGLAWNYFYNVWKTVSYSPFSNAVVFLDDSASTALPGTVTAVIEGKDTSSEGTVFTILLDEETAGFVPTTAKFVQGEDACTHSIAVHPYGAYIFPASAGVGTAVAVTVDINGTIYTNTESGLTINSVVGTEFTLTKQE